MKSWFTSMALLLVLALVLVLLLMRLEVDYRLDRFLPQPTDPGQALVANQLGDSAASRMILAGLSGADADVLAAAARTLAVDWREVPGVVAVYYGEDDFDADSWLERASWLLDHALLLVPEPESWLSEAALRQALEARLADLVTAGSAVESLVRRDPLGLLMELETALAPVQAAHSVDGVWFDPQQQRVLMVVATDVPGFDPKAQREIVAQLRLSAANLANGNNLQLELSGPAVFSVDLDAAARADAKRLSVLACAWIVLLLWWAWRRPALMLAGAVPLVAGICAGLVAVMWGFGTAFGLTLAFGFTLLGVALDYPVHVFAHRTSVRAPLSLSALSSLIAFTAIWASASPGLAQLGAFSAIGLLTAAALAAVLLPRLHLPAPPPPPAFLRPVMNAPRAAWLPPIALLLALIGLVSTHARLWSDDLSRLSPLPPEWLETDVQLRQAVGAPEVPYLIVLHDATLEGVLQHTERLAADLPRARAEGLIADWQVVTELVPSRASQRQRRAAWPDAAGMARRLQDAGAELPFKADAFQPFLDGVARLPEQPDITPETWHGTPLAARVESLLSQTADGWRALVLPAGLSHPEALSQWLEVNHGTAELVDLTSVSVSMAAAYRRDVLLSLGLALGLIALLVAWRLRRPGALLRILTPPLAAVALTAWIMATASGGLTVIHLMALILTAGVGLDYALFMQHFGARREQARATLWSLVICALSTGGVFFILGTSNIVLLAQLGRTAALGIFLSLLLVWLAREPTS